MALTANKKLIKQFKQAQQELNQGDAAKAVKLFHKLLKASNNNPQILYLMGLAYGKLGQLDKVKQVALRTLKLDPNHHGSLCNLANVLFFEGDRHGALDNYQKALTLKPDEPHIVDNYCRALNSLGRQTEAIEILDKLLKNHSHYAPAFVVKGIAYAETGQPEKASQSFEAALEMDPLLAEANLGMGNLYRFQGDLLKSEKHYQAILNVEKHHALAYVGLATIKRLIGDHGTALDIISKADELIPGHLTILTTKADILEHAGRFEEAFDLLQQLKDRGQLTALGVTSFANLCHRFGVCDEALELINTTIELPATNNLDKQMLYFSSGKLLDELKRYDEAFEQYQYANTCVDTDFNEKRDIAFADESINVFTKEAIKQFPHSDTVSSRPLFILGMPRSGTSLTEQILAAHPEVFGAGELGDIAGIANAIKQLEPAHEGGYANRMVNLPVDAINEYSKRYLHHIASLNSTERFVTDKMPHNFMYIGLISLLFPEAHIIHCRRNPMDNILSIYFQHFSGSHKYAANLKNIALFYNAYYKLMKHWEKIVKTPIYTVQYEDMVKDQEATTRNLLEFCELEWNENVLHFHKSNRSVGTASYEQVRQPIYKSSKERWRNYEKYLEEAKELLIVTT